MFSFKYINIYPHLRSTKLISESSLSCQIPLKPKKFPAVLMQSFSLYWIITSVNDNKTSQFRQQSLRASWWNNQFHFHAARPPPSTTCEHAAGCQGLNLGFWGSKTGEEWEREDWGEAAQGSSWQEDTRLGRDVRSAAAAGTAAEEKFLWF